MTRPENDPAGEPRPAFAAAVQNGLRTPLAALRATIESLSRELSAERGGDARLDGALGEVARLAKNVQALVDWAEPEPLRPLHCTPREIALAAVAGLPAADRVRVELAYLGCEGRSLFVDGPVLSRCLRHVLDAALEASGAAVLLRVTCTGRAASFVVVDADAGRRSTADLLAPFVAHAPGNVGLGLHLVQREVERMGGSFALDRTTRGHTLARIDFERTVETA